MVFELLTTKTTPNSPTENIAILHRRELGKIVFQGYEAIDMSQDGEDDFWKDMARELNRECHYKLKWLYLDQDLGGPWYAYN